MCIKIRFEKFHTHMEADSESIEVSKNAEKETNLRRLKSEKNPKFGSQKISSFVIKKP